MAEYYHQRAVFVQASVARFAGFDNLGGVIRGLRPGLQICRTSALVWKITDSNRLRRCAIPYGSACPTTKGLASISRR